MISLKSIVSRLVDVKPADLWNGIEFLAAYPIAKIFHRSHKNLWLICEDEMEARDNGFVFFKYMNENHPEQETVYAINKKSPDYEKVDSVGKTIPYGTFKHWIYYLAASQNISSQKGGKPNAAVCYFLEIGNLLKNSRTFLQHGITKDDAKWLYYKNTKFRMFVCGAKPEYDFIEERFGYPKDHIDYLGFTRFDNLHEDITDPKLVLIMPTWRNWFVLKSKNDDNKIPDVNASKFCMEWNAFINSEKLSDILEKYDLHVLFYPHRNMQQFIDIFKCDNPRITIGHQKDYDVQMLLRKCAVLITDYSSVFFDVVYMKKPVIFYQFDEEEYRKKQYQQGYFDYSNNPFSIRYTDQSDALDMLDHLAGDGFKVSDTFLSGHKEYFPLYDTSNSERTYQAIRNLDSKVS